MSLTGPGVYLLRWRDEVKIGCSIAPVRRYKAVNSQVCRGEGLLLAVVPTTDPRAMERALHAAFTASRLHGEWFRANRAVLRFAEWAFYRLSPAEQHALRTWWFCVESGAPTAVDSWIGRRLAVDDPLPVDWRGEWPTFEPASVPA